VGLKLECPEVDGAPFTEVDIRCALVDADDLESSAIPKRADCMHEPLAGSQNATIQVVTDDAGCFQAALSARVADGSRFAAEAP